MSLHLPLIASSLSTVLHSIPYICLPFFSSQQNDAEERPLFDLAETVFFCCGSRSLSLPLVSPSPLNLSLCLFLNSLFPSLFPSLFLSLSLSPLSAADLVLCVQKRAVDVAAVIFLARAGVVLCARAADGCIDGVVLQQAFH